MVSPPILLLFHRRSLLVSFVVLSSIFQFSAGNQSEEEEGVIHHRTLLGFRETPGGGNNTFDCSPSGPCVPCQYSEKNEEKYRCSETGYRIPLKCVKIGDEANETNSKKVKQGRSTLEVSLEKENLDSKSHGESTSSVRVLKENTANKKGDTEPYVTFRSCIPAVNEERLSVLGFEVLMLGLLLVSGSFIFLKRKRNATMPGAGGVRVQNNPRLYFFVAEEIRSKEWRSIHIALISNKICI
ncbi:hypothetical protein V2J09_015406 [Rumex salicifolius]